MNFGVGTIRSGLIPQLSFLMCSAQQEIVRFRLVLVSNPFGLGEGAEAAHTTPTHCELTEQLAAVLSHGHNQASHGLCSRELAG